MQTIIINKKEYKVAEEFNWLNLKLKSAKNIIQSLEDLDDDFDTQRYKYEGKKADLLNENKNL